MSWPFLSKAEALKVTPFFRNAPIIILPKVNFCEHSTGTIRFSPIHHLRKTVTYSLSYGSSIMAIDACEANSLAHSVQTGFQFLVQYIHVQDHTCSYYQTQQLVFHTEWSSVSTVLSLCRSRTWRCHDSDKSRWSLRLLAYLYFRYLHGWVAPKQSCENLTATSLRFQKLDRGDKNKEHRNSLTWKNTKPTAERVDQVFLFAEISIESESLHIRYCIFLWKLRLSFKSVNVVLSTVSSWGVCTFLLWTWQFLETGQ